MYLVGGDDVNWRPKGTNGWGPLHMAAACGDMKGLVALLDQVNESKNQMTYEGREMSRNNYLESETSRGDRPLHVALRNGQVLAARELVRAGCDVHARGKNGENVAHICAALDLAEELDRVIKSSGLDPTLLTDRGESIVHISVRNCRIGFLDWILKQPFGTVPFFSILNKAGESIMHECARCGMIVGVKWLFKYLDAICKEEDIDFSIFFGLNRDGKSPMDIARSEGKFELSMMLEDYLSKKVRDRKARRQAEIRFLNCVRTNDVKKMQSLARKHLKSFNIIDCINYKTGDSAVLWAAANGNEQSVRWLLEQKGKRKIINERTGESILHRAVQSGHIGVVKFLMKKSFIQLEAKDLQNETSLALAERLGGRQEIADTLRSQSCNTIQDDSATLDLNSDSLFEDIDPAIRARKLAELERLREWLSNLDMAEWFLKLRDEGFDSLPRLRHIEDEDLVDLGMKKGYRRSFLKAVQHFESAISFPQVLIEEDQNTESTQTCMRRNISLITDGSNESQDSSGSQPASDDFASISTSNHGLDEFQDLTEGEEVCINGHTEGNKYKPDGLPRQFILRKSGNVYECSCSQWRLQHSIPKNARTCCHLKQFRGEKKELCRIDNQRKKRFNMEAILEEIRSYRFKKPENGSTISNLFSDETSQPINHIGVPSHQVLSWEELTFGQIIGEGSFGIVRAAEWRGMLVAVKELRGNEKLLLSGSSASITGNEEESRDLSNEEFDLKHEAAMMSRVSNHENIVPFVGVLLTPRPCVVTKLMRRGSVEDMLVVPGPLYCRQRLDSHLILEMLIDAAAGVLHLHSEGVIHRDIAARNLLVDEHFRVRVADFGFARIKEINRSKGFTNTSVGPIKWMAPEAMRFRVFSEQSDAFSFGVTLYEVAIGKRPWEKVESMDVVYRICQGERLQVNPDESCLPQLCQLISLCQLSEPSDRPSMRQVHSSLLSMRQISVGGNVVGPRLKEDSRFSDTYVPLQSEAVTSMSPSYDSFELKSQTQDRTILNNYAEF